MERGQGRRRGRRNVELTHWKNVQLNTLLEYVPPTDISSRFPSRSSISPSSDAEVLLSSEVADGRWEGEARGDEPARRKRRMERS